MIEGIYPIELIEVWDRAEPLLQRVLDQFDSGYTSEDVLTELQHERMQLWKIGDWDALMVTEIYNVPRWRALLIVWCVGDRMDEWLDPAFEMLERFARAHGCKYVEGRGRRGWTKALAHRGWFKEGMTVVRKAL